MIKKNDTVRTEITDIATGGEGIGHAEGLTLFVKNSVPGDVADVHITKVKKTYAYAKAEKVITPSPFRVIPECEHANPCGGCQLMSLSYERELKYKEDKVKNNIIRIGGFDKDRIEEIFEPIMGADSDNILRYRNKLQVPIGTDKEGNLIAGFYAGRTHNIIPCDDCLLGFEEHKDILDVILSFAKRNHLSAYDESKNEGLIRHVLLRKGYATGEIMVCIVINGDDLPKADELADELKNKYPKREEGASFIANICLNINKENTNVILGKKVKTIWGKDHITDRIGDLEFGISPLSFYQVNPYQTKKLYDTALEFADLKGDENVLDLYCGTGTISLFLARSAGRVHGVEIIPEAIENAKENAKANGINNASFSVGKAEDLTAENAKEIFGGDIDVIVVDPPRKGCDEKCLETILRLSPEKIVYVSCDSATLSRDLKILHEGGYNPTRIRPTDMFPKTVHVETVCLLSNRKPDSHIKLSLDMDEYYDIIEKEEAEKKK